MRKALSRVLLAAFVIMLVSANAFAARAPKYVFYFIGDGLGASQRQVAEFYLQEQTGDRDLKLAINTLPVAGINTTYSTDSLVTDSAAAGTALATGYKTNNGVIAKLPNGRDVKTLVELVMDKGMATGIVSTTRLTHATPASFAAHNESRNNENDIAADMADSGVTFFAGGGYRHFVDRDGSLKSKRKDNADIIGAMRAGGYKTFVGDADANADFRSYRPRKGDKVFAALSYSHMPYEVDRMQNPEIVSLSEMTEKAIEVLSFDKDGFFLMVEGGRIDHACHANDVAGSIGDTIAFDDAVQVAIEFAKEHPKDTLIVVVGDHETGGLGLGFAKNYWLKMGPVQKVRASIEDVMGTKYDGDRAEFVAFVKSNFGLADMTKQERAMIEKAMDMEDRKESGSDAAYGSYRPTQIAVAHIVSERANVQWTTFAHTATQIPMSAMGRGAEVFGGYKDNTDIAKAMAEVLGVALSAEELARK